MKGGLVRMVVSAGASGRGRSWARDAVAMRGSLSVRVRTLDGVGRGGETAGPGAGGDCTSPGTPAPRTDCDSVGAAVAGVRAEEQGEAGEDEQRGPEDGAGEAEQVAGDTADEQGDADEREDGAGGERPEGRLAGGRTGERRDEQEADAQAERDHGAGVGGGQHVQRGYQAGAEAGEDAAGDHRAGAAREEAVGDEGEADRGQEGEAEQAALREVRGAGDEAEGDEREAGEEGMLAEPVWALGSVLAQVGGAIHQGLSSYGYEMTTIRDAGMRSGRPGWWAPGTAARRH